MAKVGRSASTPAGIAAIIEDLDHMDEVVFNDREQPLRVDEPLANMGRGGEERHWATLVGPRGGFFMAEAHREEGGTWETTLRRAKDPGAPDPFNNSEKRNLNSMEVVG